MREGEQEHGHDGQAGTREHEPSQKDRHVQPSF
jgi:hypothetical protein